VDKEFEPRPAASPEPRDEAEHSFQNDLQYVTVQVDGATYGGWYRLLPDGQMELLALANMHSEHRTENTPIEQARGMLTDFVRTTLGKRGGGDAQAPAVTLGSLLFSDKCKSHVPEREWAALVSSCAAGDLLALHGLFQRTQDLVFTLIVRLTRNPETAEELTLKVFEGLWQGPLTYDPAERTVLAWVMNQARSAAMNHLTFIGHLTLDGDALQFGEVEGAIGTPCCDVLWERLVQRVALPRDERLEAPAAPAWIDPPWDDVAPGIACKLLATDVERDRVSMLVRLAPGTDYPAHTHGGVEELHLLDGELWIDARKLSAGDYNRAEQGSVDRRVWSETGCTCVLVTSTRDVIM
jgi:DNA-directed RNA polymerase specialized sigma24 family protein